MDEAGPSGYDKPSLLFEAAQEGNLLLLKQCAEDINIGEALVETYDWVRDGGGRSALHVAAAAGKTNVCEYLIEEIKLDVDVIDDRGRTPLHHAVLHRHVDIAEYLLSVGACSSACDKWTYTPLHYAAEIGDILLLVMLMSGGASIDVESDYGTPLQRAIAYRNKDAVEVLLDHEADADLAGREFFTPLLCSIFANSFDCLELLLKAGADPNIRGRGMNCMTPLGQAAADGATRMVDCLLKFGADPDAIDDSGLIPLEWAAFNRHDEALSILFPVTTQLPYFPEWSVSGIMKHIHSEEARVHRDSHDMINSFREFARRGDMAFGKKDYPGGVCWYTRAITLATTRLAMKRSMCWVHLHNGLSALYDARLCIGLRPDSSQAHCMEGAAWKIFKIYPMAAAAYSRAQKLLPYNEEIKKLYQEASELAGRASTGEGTSSGAAVQPSQG
ncbi:Ankyrin repeat domain-containing protein 55 [Sesamum alatum]|uniref:Ankyrin repeat domain-containing protein 55 n=1 Tax=Sesamum alatum TaxID=300844 RepID=A0AAE2CDP1_9LAMI|nr:Ankyrin repeat domain-containing protein 55 [Sesamum alatum]